MNNIDAYFFRRLLAGQTLNGELDDVSTEFRPLADAINAMAPDERGRTWDIVVMVRPDGAQIVEAMFRADAGGPMPEPDSPVMSLGRLTCAADVVERDVEWLWKDRVPLGMPTMFAGDPKVGKSFITTALAAATSRGRSLRGGGDLTGPASVIIMNAEDDPSRTIVKRLRAAGADLRKIHILESVFLRDGTEALPSLRQDIATIEAMARGLGDCRLITIDPVSAYLDGVDDHRNAELRGLLSPLKRLVEVLNAACPLVSHLTKSRGTNGRHRVQGSIAYVGACRANFLFIRDRTDPTGRRVLICDNGQNLVPTVETIAYKIEDFGDGPMATFFDEPVAITTTEALAAEADAEEERTRGGVRTPERQMAEQWLGELLANGPVPAKEAEEAARRCGISPKILRSARENMKVATHRVGFGKDSTFHWSLTNATTQPIESP
jgi:hypothetical protein